MFGLIDLSCRERSRKAAKKESFFLSRDHVDLSIDVEEAYLDHIIRQVFADFSTLIILGKERMKSGKDDLKDGLKSVKLTEIEVLQTMVEKQSRNTKKVQVREERMKAKSEVNIVSL